MDGCRGARPGMPSGSAYTPTVLWTASNYGPQSLPSAPSPDGASDSHERSPTRGAQSCRRSQTRRAERHQPGVRRRGHRQDRRLRGVRHRGRARRRGRGPASPRQEALRRGPGRGDPHSLARPHPAIAARRSAPAAAACGRGWTTRCSSSTRPGRCGSRWSTWAGLRDFELLPIVGMADPWRYRNRADFSIGMSEQGAVDRLPAARALGLRPSHLRVPLLDPGLEQARATVEAWLREEGLPGWDPRSGEGFARHLLARSAQRGAELLVSLVTVPGELPGAEPAGRTAALRSSAARGRRPRRQRRTGGDQQRPRSQRPSGAGRTCWRRWPASPSRSRWTPSSRRTPA